MDKKEPYIWLLAEIRVKTHNIVADSKFHCTILLLLRTPAGKQADTIIFWSVPKDSRTYFCRT